MTANRTPSFLIITARCLLQGFSVGILTSILLSLLVLLLSPAAGAMTADHGEAPTVEHPADVTRGSLLLKTANGLEEAPLLQTDVRFAVSGLISRARLQQSFMNESNEWVEAVYVFPLPGDAAVDSLRMIIGERIIAGQISEREEAKKTYEQAKNNGQRASLVEQERPNIFTTSVANIGPGETVTVEIEFQQSVRYDNGEFSLRFPMVVAPRFIPGTQRVHGFSGHGWGINTDEVDDAQRITPPVIHPDTATINPVRIEVRLDSGFALENIMSPYHAIAIEQQADTRYTITLKDGAVAANRDFELSWRAVPGASPRAALFTEHYAHNHYAKVMVLPPATGAAGALRRQVIFVIDTSGSMGGTSIRQARAALLLALERLQTGDTFNVIQFNSRTDSLFDRPEAVNPQTLRSARAYIQRLQAGGGTVMLPALEQSLLQSTKDHDVRQVIFLTDGSVGNEDALFDTIRRHIGDTRLFTVGIGSAPNAHFMRRASRFGRGTYTYIGDVNEVGERMQALFAKLESAVMTGIRVQGVQQAEMWPQAIPDLYSGEPLLFTLRADELPESLTVSGQVAGQPWSSELVLDGGQDHQGVARLWARRKIAALMDQRGGSEEAEQIRRSIIDVALEHHLVSKYTSLVAVDVTPARVREALLKTMPVPVNLPHGWDYDKVFGKLPQTATPATGHMLAGLLCLIAGLVLLRGRRHV